MTKEDKILIIAEAHGWTHIEDRSGPLMLPRGTNLVGYPPKGAIIGRKTTLPDYLNDRNAIVAAVQTLRDSPLFARYNVELFKVVTGVNLSQAVQIPRHIFDTITATSAQQAEAFLRTIGKWTDL